ncbi:MAG: isopentenyl transferase family protein [Spartobacteria bacterium]
MRGVFFIVGPTSSGKSELAADVAREVEAEIVSADAFQIYEGFPLLTAKPDAVTLAKAPHHLIGTMSILQEMSAQKFRRAALAAIAQIHERGKRALVVGGSGLYVKALTHGLNDDWKKVEAELPGVFVFRDRDALYARINARVEAMLASGAIDEVRAAGAMSATAAKMMGLREIRSHLDSEMSISPQDESVRLADLQCVAKIQQATRQYAKRQLTWFRHQTNFEPLNLSLLTHGEAVERISQRAQSAFVEQG